ncbi:MAG: dUTP diphosphatase [Nitrospina sp.]|nr:dUTP diphosphatase [Nitrospina sp.]MBT3413608.1 dUTP diphosphatase [Nitrospina sp.]MBT3856096.1 dUTP diphosphatase [Nitrospina sp.]MBT4105281.1 dUTP diphosphatase [Nitrospina sp.]MBT4388601.1 dUTP diphosphatase [Nitrospina sp.]
MNKTDSPPVPCKGDYLPQYSHQGDAGADLKAVETRVIAPRGRELVATGIRLELPEGHAGLIWPRSGPAVKLGLDCGAGVIDSHYRGEIKVLLFNHSDEEIHIQSGDRIAQLIIQKVETVKFIFSDQLSETARNTAGFGSTGDLPVANPGQ